MAAGPGTGLVPATAFASETREESASSDQAAENEGSRVAANPLRAYWAWKDRLKRDGFDFVINYTSEDLIAVRGGNSDALVHAGQASFTGQADMERLVGWKGGAVTLSISHRDGQGINTRSGIGALLGPQEIFGRGNVTRISQFWIDQKLGDRVSLRVGRSNPGSDFEEFDCDFINLSYCGNQVGNIVSDYWYNYPISQWGAIAKVATGSATYVKVGVYQVNPRNLTTGFLDVLNPSGGTGALVPAEFGWSPRVGRNGAISVKVGGWYSTAARDDVYLDRERAPAAASGLPFQERDGSYGGYSSVVARFHTHEGGDRNVKIFFNATLADAATSIVDRSLAAGMVWTGPFAARARDQVGIAISANHLNRRLADYRRERLSLGFAAGLPGTSENALELFYGAQVSRFLQIRPDVQWLHRPGGTKANRDAIIVGARTAVSF
ncbi:carbohydrate porin [Novosphingobium sp. ZW T3_23]|uniref:carbohydrate porin n=1 Tax=Novosphingobium sp. ZW T3_23 TaxID=3378084 RepID=UPI003853B5E9